MRRGGPLKADPAKTRAWQARGAKKYADRPRRSPQVVDNVVDNAVPVSGPRMRGQKRTAPKKRRNDGPWRDEVMAAYGECCRSCGDTAHVQADHMMPKSQGGKNDVRNGLPLCGEFSRNTPGGCHPAKTDGRMLIQPGWLEPEQIAWLADVGWVAWDDDGQPHGRGWRHFAPRRGRGERERVDGHGE